MKLKSAWIDRLLVTDGWTFRRSGDDSIVGHLIRREEIVESDETLKILIDQPAKQP